MYSVLSLFPSLFIYSFLAPTILRVVLSIILFIKARRRFKAEQTYSTATWIALIEILAAIALFVGAFTQAAALILIISTISKIIEGGKETSTESKYLSALTIVILLSLMITGPGALAVDMPL